MKLLNSNLKLKNKPLQKQIRQLKSFNRINQTKQKRVNYSSLLNKENQKFNNYNHRFQFYKNKQLN